jgi:predicted GTPase
MAGTTRDYVNAVVWTGKTEAEIIDTAGLDDEVAKAGLVDRVAQDKTLEVLSDCDVVLNVIDASKDGEIRRFDGAGCVVNVLNKSDLGVCEKYSGLSNSVVISARLNEGIDELMDAVHRQLGLLDKSSEKGCCFSMVLESEFYKALVADDILIVRKVMEGLVSSQDEFFYAEDL